MARLSVRKAWLCNFMLTMIVSIVRADRTVLNIDLCSLCLQLSKHIPDIGGAQATGATGPACLWDKCLRSNKFHRLRHNTLSMFKSEGALAGKFEHINGTEKMQLDMTSEHAAELLVMAFMGRHLIASTPEETFDVPATFEYNVVKERLQISYPVCRYEKTFYLGLLVVSVIVIILALGLRFWEKNKKAEDDEEEDDALPTIGQQTVASQQGTTQQAHIPRVLHANVVRVGAMQRSDVRYRAVSTEII